MFPSFEKIRLHLEFDMVWDENSVKFMHLGTDAGQRKILLVAFTHFCSFLEGAFIRSSPILTKRKD